MSLWQAPPFAVQLWDFFYVTPLKKTRGCAVPNVVGAIRCWKFLENFHRLGYQYRRRLCLHRHRLRPDGVRIRALAVAPMLATLASYDRPIR